MKGMIVFTLLFIIILTNQVLAATIGNHIPVQIQTTTTSGEIVTGTFSLIVNISNSDDCSSVLYSNTTTQTTDSRGIISYDLENVDLPFNEQYYLCYYRDGVLKRTLKLGRAPYAFNSKFLQGYNSSAFMPFNKTGIGDFTFNGTTSFNGNTNFNGAWQDGGLSIINGDIFAQNVFTVNLTSLNVSSLGINGSLIPNVFDNTFDLGSSSLNWKDLWLGGNADILGTLTAAIIKSNDWTNVSIVKTQVSDFPTLLSEFTDDLVHTTDTNETTRFDTLTNTDCSAGNLVIGIQSDGTVLCATDESGGSSPWNRSSTNVFLANTGDNVGIGTTSPTSLLNVDGTANITGKLGSTALIVDSDGEVGVGIANPLQKFHVQGGVRISQPDGTSVNLGLLNTEASGVGAFIAADGDKLMIKNNDVDAIVVNSIGNIGIRDTTPDFSLEVVSNFSVSSTEAGNGDLFMVRTDGNVGIGTTSPEASLHVNSSLGGGIRLESSASKFGFISSVGNNHISQNTYFNGANWVLIEDGNASGFQTNTPLDEAFRVFTNTSSLTAGTALSFSVPFVVKTSGKVGIGTTSPLDKLHIQTSSIGLDSNEINAEQILIEHGDAGIGIYSTEGGTFGSRIVLGEINAGTSNLVNKWGLIRTTGTGGDLLFTFGTNKDAAANTEIMRLTDGGKVGIGTTSPNSLFETAKSSGTNEINLSGILYVNSTSGRVGIGTTSPAALLDVGANTRIGINTIAFAGSSTITSGGLLTITAGGTRDFNLVVSGGGNLILNGGNVGIGTQIPTHKLNVVGDLNVTGTVWSGDKNISLYNVQTFTASGTWTKPAGAHIVIVEAWGAGGGGGRDATGAGGAGGGAYFRHSFQASDVGATETVTIGIGGTGRTGSDSGGTAGGSTTFGSLLTAYGGGAGDDDGTAGGTGGGGGGILSAGNSGTGTDGGDGGGPDGGLGNLASAGGGGSSFGGGGGGDLAAFAKGGASGWGGGGGGGSSTTFGGDGGASIYGGGGGGGGADTADGSGGTSLFGGDGGAGAHGGSNGVDGTQPGGGGGGCDSSGGACSAGDGALGKVIVTTW